MSDTSTEVVNDSIDVFHVKGADGVIRSLDEHYDCQNDVEQDPYGAWLAIQNQANRIEELEAAKAEARAKALDAAHKYLCDQYGNSPLGHPIDRKRILALIPADQEGDH